MSEHVKMKVISIWQPYASLLVHGFKFFETRTWPAPRAVIGQRIGIAATKAITPAQRDAFNDPVFAYYYEQSGLPPLEELPRGHLLGTALLHSVDLITEDLLDDITQEEQAFGWFEPGGYAWRMRYPNLFDQPVVITGKQGIFEWKGFEGAKRNAQLGQAPEKDTDRSDQGSGAKKTGLRLHLHSS